MTLKPVFLKKLPSNLKLLEGQRAYSLRFERYGTIRNIWTGYLGKKMAIVDWDGAYAYSVDLVTIKVCSFDFKEDEAFSDISRIIKDAT